ncbi:MAG: LysR family transcriptional regulator [Aestuariibacter sp.]
MHALIPHLPYFSSVAKHLNFSAAARDLSLSQATISYQIKSLEDKLGFSVLNRQKGGKVALTKKGRRLLLEYQLVEKNMGCAIRELTPNATRTEINITTPVDFGALVIVPLIKRLEERKLVINLHLEDKVCNFKESEFDIAIRANKTEERITHKLLYRSESILVCSKTLAMELTDRKLTECPVLLRQKVFSRTWQQMLQGTDMQLSQFKRVRIINNSFALLEAVMNSLGIALLPRFMVQPYLMTQELAEFPANRCNPAYTDFYLAYHDSYIVKGWCNIIDDVLRQYLSSLALSVNNLSAR